MVSSKISNLTAPKSAVPSLKVEFLFLDNNTCQPCSGTGRALEEAIEITAAPLAAMGVDLHLEKIHVVDKAIAQEHKFLTSPTIRINGHDIDPARTEELCSSCGDLTNGKTAVDCRNWHWRGTTHKSAPIGKIVEAIMAAATNNITALSADTSNADTYIIPENLESFFNARQSGKRAAADIQWQCSHQKQHIGISVINCIAILQVEMQIRKILKTFSRMCLYAFPEMPIAWRR